MTPSPSGPPDPPSALAAPGRAGRGKTWAALLVMLAGVLAAYFPIPSAPGQNTLFGADYLQLHARRIRFAQESLLAGGGVPAWYPRELMGTPFWSNVQNFPLIPTRLVLLALDPMDGFAAGVLIAALLSAGFTFLFCRRLGMGAVGAAVAGWTFACAGFFASRVTAGHLPVLEAYPLLPLWLWLAERCRQAAAAGRPTWRGELALALAGLCGAGAGHPQVPFYAAVVTGLYLLCRGPLRTGVRLGGILALGMACGAFVWWPMLSLIGRSTRVLALDAPQNDVNFPVGRLGAFVLPWKDGWPEAVLGAPGRAFGGYPNHAYFWDTVCYVGLLPVAAVVFLTIRAAARRQRPPAPALFFAAAGLLAVLTALPAVQRLVDQIPGTILRSPARQVYVTTFALALAAGAALHVICARAAVAGGGPTGPRRARTVALVTAAVLVAAHGLDLGAHARAFVRMAEVDRETPTEFVDNLRRGVGDGRVAIDYQHTGPFVRAIDDVGVFDSILLARPYAAVLDLAGLSPTLNAQVLNGPSLDARALECAGVRLVVTVQPRPDLEFLDAQNGLRVYGTRDPAARAAFFPAGPAVVTRSDEQVRALLRDPAHDPRRRVIVPPGDYGLGAQPMADVPAGPATVAAPLTDEVVEYQRPSADEIVVRVQAPSPGFLRVLETWDPGWRAAVSGVPVDVVPADGTFLAVALPPGGFEVRFTYATPGVATGAGMSLASACVLAAIVLRGRRPAASGATVADVPRDSAAPMASRGRRRSKQSR